MTTTLLTAEWSALEFLGIEELRVDDHFAAKLPQPENLDAIRASVRERGIVIPLFATKDKLLLDGHTRLAVARELGIAEVPVVRLPLDAADDWAKTVTLALNVHRRHLNSAQRAQLVTSLEKLERARAKERQESGRRAGGERRKRKLGGNSSPQASRRDEVRHEENRATARAAKAAGISRKTYERAKRVVAEAERRHAC